MVLNISGPGQLSATNPKPQSLWEVYAIVLVSYAVFLITLHLLGSPYWSLVGGTGFYEDNNSYMELAGAIQHWQFADVTEKYFWGLPYFIAGVSIITGLPNDVAFAMVGIIASLTGITLAYSLWGGRVTIYFAILCWEWLKVSLLGGAETLCIALLLGCFVALRRNHWRLATVLGAIATTVRPFAVFALIGLAVQLLYQKRYRDCAVAAAIGLVIGGLYVWPMQHYFGNPFSNVAVYQAEDWDHGIPFWIPFWAIIENTFPLNGTLTNMIFSWCTIALVLFSLYAGARDGDFKRYAVVARGETCFVLLYCLALFTYNSPEWSRAVFPRYSLPVIPWIVYFLRQYLPASRRLQWSLAIVSPAIAVLYTTGFYKIIEHFKGDAGHLLWWNNLDR